MATNYNASYHASPNLTLCVHDGTDTNHNCSDVLKTSTPLPDDDDIWTPDVIQRVASLAFIMTLTLVGNTVIIVVLTCSRYRKRNSRVNIFIINLAIGDLAVCVCTMTTEILFVAFGQWVLGPAACKILTYLQIVTLASTTFILTSMSFDRSGE
ncbi:kiSS-1 receptor-like [Littorina saxatilis]|uniref:kiSS-1 receptor-like n=1 Tax=Littorina saxatilis TaxID=31220 RepID=UPI0038B4F3A8